MVAALSADAVGDTAPGDSAAEEARFAAQNELSTLEAAVAVLDYPLSFSAAIEKLGGKKVLVWSFGTSGGPKNARRSQQFFEVITPHLKDKGYVVVLEGDHFDGMDSSVTKVAVGYRTPLGSFYFADLRDEIAVLHDAKKKG